MSTAAIGIRNLSHDYVVEGRPSTRAIEDITLNFSSGEFVAIVGPSGCGKTSLLNILAGMEPVQVGAVELLGELPRAGRSDIGYMLARDCLLPWRRAIDNAALVLEMQGLSRAERRRRAHEQLKSLGMANFERSYPAQLSQGMRQRVALARVFSAAPDILLLDEPFSALDAQTRGVIQDTFLRVWESRRSTVVLVTHDLGEAIALADVVVVLGGNPGTVKAIHRIDLDRPRVATEARHDRRFQEIYDKVWLDLRNEISSSMPVDVQLADGLAQAPSASGSVTA